MIQQDSLEKKTI